MFKRLIPKLDSVIDLDGVSSKYYPRFRPRRLVLPVDPSDVHSEVRHSIHPFHRKAKSLKRLQRSSERRGSIVLAEVPAERTVGDAFRLMLGNFELWSSSLFASVSSTSLFLPKHEKPLSPLSQSFAWCSPHLSRLYKILLTHYPSFFQDSDDSGRENLSAFVSSSTRHSREHYENADLLWDLVNRTPLNSPVHGTLALRGKALVESTLLSALYFCHGRLRTLHAQQFLHECCGLLPCGRIATRLGLGQLANVDAEINMWRELNILTQRVEEARRRAAQHRERAEKGVTQQRRWFWRAALKSATGRLKMFPVHREDIQSRMEWIQQLLYSFVAFLEVSYSSSLPFYSSFETSGCSDSSESSRGHVFHPMEETVLMLFAPSLLRFIHDQQVLRVGRQVLSEHMKLPSKDEEGKVEKRKKIATSSQEPFNSFCLPSIVSSSAVNEGKIDEDSLSSISGVLWSIREEMQRIASLTKEEKEVMNEGHHPLNTAADRRREQFESSGGAHSMESLRCDLQEKHFEHFQEVGAPSVVNSTRVTNALKEAQLILQYSPLVHPLVARQKRFDEGEGKNDASTRPTLNVEQVLRRTVEVHETNPYATLTTGRQQFRPVEYRVCRLFYGRYCLGEGKGESLTEAIQMAAQQMVSNYYLRGCLQPLWRVSTLARTKKSPCRSATDLSSVVEGKSGVVPTPCSLSRSKSRGTGEKVAGAYETNGVMVSPPVIEEELLF